MSYTVGQVAGFAGVTVRTLHHYDEIGLLSPNDRSAAGYRRYTDVDLERLQQIMLYRELGFPLDEIAAILDDPDSDPLSHLSRQHGLLSERIRRIGLMVVAVEKAMEANKMGIALTPEERFEVFGENDPAQYADEAEQRWGDTDAYRESARRTRSYTKDDWLLIKAEAAEVGQRMIDAMASGAPATSETAMAAAEAHRQHISRRFYDCPYEMHKGLAAMYVADPRFTATYEAQAEGLAQYTHDAIMANAARA
ncbi:MAG TPA: MerR family transcriptional regulator [Micromonosporaceae bacterium]